MTTETENPTWGEEPPPRADAPGPRWSGRRTLAAVAIAVGIAAVGGGVIYAASNSEAARMVGGPGGYGKGPAMRITGPGPFGASSHGEFQNGEVTEVDQDSVTVESADGFSRTYRVDGDTDVEGAKGGTGSLAPGDTVMVISTDGTAKSIVEGDFPRGDRKGKPGDGRQPPPTR